MMNEEYVKFGLIAGMNGPIVLKAGKEVARLRRYAIEKAQIFFHSIGQRRDSTVHYNISFKELKKFFKGIRTLYKKRLESKNIAQIIQQGAKDYYHKFYL